jgi:hypothetical protein
MAASFWKSREGGAVPPRNRPDTPLAVCASTCRTIAIALFAATFLLTSQADARGRLEQAHEVLREDVPTTLALVADAMGVRLDPDEPLPVVRLASRTPLARFREAMAPQWGFRPHIIVNAYALATNEIYLDDASDYYKRLGRTLDDSLAHELVHYLQVHYRGLDLTDESCETEAVSIQTAYRERLAFTARGKGIGARDPASGLMAAERT